MTVIIPQLVNLERSFIDLTPCIKACLKENSEKYNESNDFDLAKEARWFRVLENCSIFCLMLVEATMTVLPFLLYL